MKKTIQTFLSAGATLVVVFVFAAPSAHAVGVYYADSTSDAKSDFNSCLTPEAPCETIAGALTKITDSADPSNSTLRLQGTFVESVSIFDTTLEGLTITRIGSSGRPVIDAGGAGIALFVSQVNGVTVSNIQVTNFSTYGVYYVGGGQNRIEGGRVENVLISDASDTAQTVIGLEMVRVADAVVLNNVIQDISPQVVNDVYYMYVYGIYLQGSDNAVVRGNLVRRIEPTLTYDLDNTYTSLYTYGLYVLQSDNVSIRNNTFEDIGGSSVHEVADTYTYMTVYGMWVQAAVDALVRENTLTRVGGSAHTTAANTSIINTLYGIGLSSSVNSTLHRNTIQDITVSSISDAGAAASATVYAIYNSGISGTRISRNTVTGASVSGDSTSSSGSVQMYNFYVEYVEALTFRKNVIAQNAVTPTTGGATQYGLYLSDVPDSVIYNNTFGDLTAAVDDPAGTENSYGFYLGYNANAKIFNNRLYFSAPQTQTEAVGISVVSQQADPLRIYHNTISNMMVCIDMEYAGQTDIRNNICRLGQSGAFAFVVKTANYPMTNLTSNFNILYNSAEPVQMKDETVGTMGLESWRAGEYLQDKKSVAKNPRLNVANPGGKKYLNVKKKSPAVNAGVTGLTFGKKDPTNNALLRLDRTNQKRPSGKRPDMGADELNKK